MGRDLISELPDSLIHHILSFLDMVYVVPTCVLSKRWRYIWTSMPYLCFDENDFSSRPRYGVRGFREFIDKAMSVRLLSNTVIHTFRIFEDIGDHAGNDDVVKWINSVVQHRVVVLDITVMLDVLELPHSLLKSKSVETISLTLAGQNSILSFESHMSVDLPALRTLRLERLDFWCEDINNLISGCQALQELVLSRCLMIQNKNLIVSAPQLKHLEILNMYVSGSADEEFCYHNITAFAPNLTSLKCEEERFMGDYSLLNNNSPMLKAELNLLHIFKEEDELLAYNVRKCFAQIAKVKALYLKLPSWLFQDVFAPHPIDGSSYPVTPFGSLIVLKLRISVVEQQTHARTCILEICPNLESLTLDIVEDGFCYIEEEMKGSSVDEEVLPTKMPPECIWHHLKFVEIWGRASRLENEFAFVKFLLQNASLLETLSFQHGQFCQRSRVLKFVDKVKTIRRASPNVKISLMDWKARDF